MSLLRVYTELSPEHPVAIACDANDIARRLAPLGVRFERWQTGTALPPGAGQDAVLTAYRAQVEQLNREFGFRSVDVASLHPAHPDRAALRARFLAEHTHADFEARFFVAGQGLFFLHPDEAVYALLCTAGDLISVPAGTRHWFDMGAAPCFQCIRFFTTPEGWVADFTGDAIAHRFPTLEQFLAEPT